MIKYFCVALLLAIVHEAGALSVTGKQSVEENKSLTQREAKEKDVEEATKKIAGDHESLTRRVAKKKTSMQISAKGATLLGHQHRQVTVTTPASASLLRSETDHEGFASAGKSLPSAPPKGGQDDTSVAKGPLWYPKDYELGSPFFLHYPHRCFGECGARGNTWVATELAKVKSSRDKAIGMPKDVAFVFPTSDGYSKGGTPLVQQFYDELGVPYHSYGQSWQPWDWWGKVTPLKKMMLDGTISEPYVLYTDAGDVGPNTTDFTGLVKAFQSYNASVVLGARPGCFPFWMPRDACKFGELVYPWAKRQGVQAGTFMAERNALLKYFDLMEHEKGAISPADHKFDDQAAWAILHMKHYPDIKADTQEKLFYRLAPT